MKLLSDDEFLGGSAGGGSTLLNDDQFMGGSTAPAKPATSGKMLSDDEFLNGTATAEAKPADGASLPAEIGKGVAAGAAGTASSMLKGAAGQNAAMLQSRIDDAKNRLKAMDLIDAGKPVPADFGDELLGTQAEVYLNASPEERKGLRESQQTVIDTATQPGDVTQSPLFKAGTATQNWSDEQFKAAKDYEGSWTRSISEGLGSTLPFLFSGSAASTMAAGSLASSGQQIDDAIKHGATKEQILKAVKLGGIPGLTEDLPIETLFERIPLPLYGKMANAIGQVLSQAAAEGGQEMLQQAAQNLIAKYVYNPDQDLTEGVLQSGAIGAIVGGGMKSVMPHTYRKDGTPGAPAKGQDIPQGATSADTLFGQESADGAPPPSADTAAGGLPPPPAATSTEVDRPNSPRLTAEDRASPLPNDLIDDGKKIFEDALGGRKKQPTTAADVPPLDGQIITPEHQRDAAKRVADIAGEFGPPSSQAARPALERTIDGTLAGVEPGSAPVPAPVRHLSDREFIDGISPIDDAAHAAATSPLNDRPQPTDAMTKAGNYAKGHTTVGGLDVSIENPQGSERSGVDASGKAWKQTLQSHYGYVKGHIGSDGDHVDVFIKPGTPPDITDASPVFVINQTKANGGFDETKTMLGFGSQVEADAAYHANYAKGWKGGGDIVPTTLGEYKAWLANGDTTKPFRAGPKSRFVNQIPETAVSGQPAPQIEGRNATSAAEAVQRRPVEARPTASWVIRNKETGDVVMETFDRKKVDALNTEKYEAVPILEHLVGLNKAAKEAGGVQSTEKVATASEPTAQKALKEKIAAKREDAKPAAKPASEPQSALKEKIQAKREEATKAAEEKPPAKPEPKTESTAAEKPSKAKEDFSEEDIPAFLKKDKAKREADTKAREKQDELFALRPDAMAAWQKHARRILDGTVSIRSIVLRDSPVLASVIGGKGSVTLDPKRAQAIRNKHRDIPDHVWMTLPNLLADPRFIFTRRDGSNTVALMAKLDDGSNIIVGLKDGEIATITPWDNADGESEMRLANEVVAALSRLGKVYAVTKKALDEVIELTGSNSRADGPRGTALPHQGRKAKIITRNDIVKAEAENGGNEPRADLRDADAGRDQGSQTRGEEGDRLRTRGVQQIAEDQGASIRPTDAFKGQAQAVGKRLRAELDRLGLKDIGLRISENLGLMVEGKMHAADGSYFRKLISVSLDAENPDSVLDHEAIHALRDVGAFTKDEWSILERKSRKEWVGKYEIADTYGQFPAWVHVEEGIAHAYADWRAGRSMDGIIAKAFKKIRGVIQAIGKAFGKDFRTAEDVFAQVASGEVGNRAADVAANPVGASGQPLFQAAWHGSPHEFDQFSLDKIGTGEGAQAFGWGMYFAGKKEIAEYYRDTLSDTADIRVKDSKGVEFDPAQHPDWRVREAALHLDEQKGDADKAISEIERGISQGFIDDSDGRAEIRHLKGWEEQGISFKKKTGKLYKVDIPDDGKMLAWDKPLSQQSDAVRKALGIDEIAGARTKLDADVDAFYDTHAKGSGWDTPEYKALEKRLDSYRAEGWKALGIERPRGATEFTGPEEISGEDYYRALADSMGGDEAASHYLKERGVPGLRYLDASSRGKAEGSHNYVVFDDSHVKIEERFKLRTAPKTAEDGQKTMQGMIARGQPIDRALRLPFQFFGGVDEKGRWKPGLYLSDKAASIITTAKINPEGRFGWLAGPVEAARAGLIDRYGLSPEYVERDRQRHMDERAITMRGAEVLKTLAEQNVGANEARVLQAILTGEAVSDKDMQNLATPIRQAIDELGQEAVSLGLVSAESFERNRGSYLHRVYAKHESEQNNLTKLVSQIMGSKRKKILGDTLKGRGLFWEVDSARLNGGNVTKGEKYRVLDKVSDGGKVTSRVYLPANEDVPSKYTGKEWRDNGTWEARQVGKGKVTLWRDYSQAERTKMGEILDARYTIGKTYLHMAHDLAVGRFYKDIAENEDWASSSEPATKWVEADQHKRLVNDREVAWVKVPDTTISDTGGKKRWGALSGKWVRSEIWRDLNEIEIMNRPSTWRMLLRQWKQNKTSRNPVTHMNNVMSNLMLMDMQDVRMQDLQAGLRSFISKDKHWQDANEHGVFGADMMTQEIRDNVLKPILEEIEKQGQDGVQNSFLARAGVLGKFADRLWSGAKTVDSKMTDLYRAEDDVFRLASYRAGIARGETPEHAAAAAREQFLDYDIHAPWVNAARNSLLPFISYTYRAVPLIARSLATRPWKLAKYAMVAYALNALAYAWDDGDEDKERASLRDEEQGYTWLQTPRMMRMPFRNADGLPVFLDVRRWIPGGDVFDTNQGSSAVPVPAPLQFGGPLMLAFELALNKSSFTGDPITNDLTDNWFDKSSKVGDYLWKAWMPSAAWVPNSWYWTKIENAIKGATDAKGRPYSLPEAVSSSFGVKLKPQDVETGIFWHYKDMKDVDTALRAEARTLARQRDRGLISQKAFDSGMQSLLDKRDRLVEHVKELQGATRKK